MNREYILIWCKKFCNNPNLTDTEDFSVVLTEIINAMERAGVTSQSLSDMSQSFGETYMSVGKMLSPYKRLKMI
jgi:hypothetical protein